MRNTLATQPLSLVERDIKPGYIKAKQLNVYEGQVLPWQDGLLKKLHPWFVSYLLALPTVASSFCVLALHEFLPISHLHPTFFIWGGWTSVQVSRVEASSFPCQSSQWANSLRKTKGEDGRRLKWSKHMPCSPPCSPAAIFRSLELSLCEARSYNQTSSHKDIIASAQHGAADHATVAHSVEILNNILNIVQ